MFNVTLTAKSPVHAAILAADGPSNLARRLNVSRPTLDKWRKRGWFPEHRIEAVALATGLSVTLLKKRPSLPVVKP